LIALSLPVDIEGDIKLLRELYPNKRCACEINAAAWAATSSGGRSSTVRSIPLALLPLPVTAGSMISGVDGIVIFQSSYHIIQQAKINYIWERIEKENIILARGNHPAT
jgi:hypothetical protein